MKIRTIITGATGMVGEGVLHECLLHKDVEAVLVINRKSCGVHHPKLMEIIHPDFSDISGLKKQLEDFNPNACYFCAGTTSVGKEEAEYRKLTYDLTLGFAKTLSSLSSHNDITFCYVSGAGTYSSEQGRFMWARVKGKAENDLMKLPFKKTYAFRPGYMNPTKGLKNAMWWTHILKYIYPLMKLTMRAQVSTLSEVGIVMINVTLLQPEKSVLEVRDILDMAKEM